MKLVERMKQFIADYLKKRYIRKEIRMKFGLLAKDVNKRNDAHIEHITESLFRGSKIVKAEMVKTEQQKFDYENELLMNDIKKIIDNHYKKREKALNEKEHAIKVAQKSIEKNKEREKQVNEAIKTLAKA